MRPPKGGILARTHKMRAQGGQECPRSVMVFHAGTKMENGALVTSGGRVLSVTATGATMRGAVENAYAGVAKIHFNGAHFRKDIARRALVK